MQVKTTNWCESETMNLNVLKLKPNHRPAHLKKYLKKVNRVFEKVNKMVIISSLD